LRNKQGNETMKQDSKLYTQTQIAHKLGISKGTLSKWIIKYNVSPETTKGNRKLYKETLVEAYRKSKKDHKAINSKEHRESFSTVDFLKKEGRPSPDYPPDQ
ncbi:MerR family transcriptional regulator, partial [Lactobacillus helveticus]|uniref:MerR family transcriptional regulator n=1 Tax=Lactobacillus helveticus TaxID=1587 RepID=UPI001C268843